MQSTEGTEEIHVSPDGRVNTAGAARFLGCSPKTLAHMRCRGEGPVFIKRGRVFYYVSDLTEWLNRSGRLQSTAQARLAHCSTGGGS
jgi:hypothetical protein